MGLAEDFGVMSTSFKDSCDREKKTRHSDDKFFLSSITERTGEVEF